MGHSVPPTLSRTFFSRKFTCHKLAPPIIFGNQQIVSQKHADFYLHLRYLPSPSTYHAVSHSFISISFTSIHLYDNLT
jgi:hypothetical protein